MSVCQMSVGQMSSGNMPVDQMPVGQMHSGQCKLWQNIDFVVTLNMQVWVTISQERNYWSKNFRQKTFNVKNEKNILCTFSYI
jgi:hypothetical protein